MPPNVDYALYLVTDGPLALGRPVESVVAAAVAGGCTVVQLREKRASTRRFVDLARALSPLLARRGVPLIVNDRVDVALACSADGVHVGQDDMRCRDVRRLVGDRLLVGVSVATPDEARQAESEGANYLGVSPVWPTATKTDTPAAVDLSGLAAIRHATRLPLVGIGGVNASNAAQVIAAGAEGVAVVSAIMSAQDPEAAARELVGIVRAARRTT
jgi:thiamine-phosphate pyrophosphorylase